MLGDLHTLFSWTNDDLAFWRRLVMSLTVALLLLIILTKLVNSSTSSKFSFSNSTGNGVSVSYIVLVFFLLMFKPSWLAANEKSDVFRCNWSLVEDTSAISLAKSRSSSKDISIHLMPCLLLPIVLRIIQSMATKNNMGDRTQPWRTPLLTLNQSVSFFLWITLQEKLL